MTRQLELYLGEVRHVRLHIRNLKNEEFEIEKAEFRLKGEFQSEIEDQGEAQIIGHTIDVLISPKIKCTYELVFEYRINDETLLEVINIRVV